MDNDHTPRIEIRILDDRLIDWGGLRYATPRSAAIDLFACIAEPLLVRPQAPAVLIPTGFAMNMPSDLMFSLIAPRSGTGHKKGLVCGNTVGIIDADYQGQCYISAWNRNPPDPEAPDTDGILVEPGDRIAQMAFLPILRVGFDVVETFSRASERGAGGFGSTGVR